MSTVRLDRIGLRAPSAERRIVAEFYDPEFGMEYQVYSDGLFGAAHENVGLVTWFRVQPESTPEAAIEYLYSTSPELIEVEIEGI